MKIGNESFSCWFKKNYPPNKIQVPQTVWDAWDDKNIALTSEQIDLFNGTYARFLKFLSQNKNCILKKARINERNFNLEFKYNRTAFAGIKLMANSFRIEFSGRDIVGGTISNFRNYVEKEIKNGEVIYKTCNDRLWFEFDYNSPILAQAIEAWLACFGQTLNNNSVIDDSTVQEAADSEFVDDEFDIQVAKVAQSSLTKDSVKGNTKPELKEYTAQRYERDPAVVAYALQQANGICGDCGCEAPFIRTKGILKGLPYLEVHHVKMLKDHGTDTVDNVIALCPNCHRKRHCGM